MSRFIFLLQRRVLCHELGDHLIFLLYVVCHRPPRHFFKQVEDRRNSRRCGGRYRCLARSGRSVRLLRLVPTPETPPSPPRPRSCRDGGFSFARTMGRPLIARFLHGRHGCQHEQQGYLPKQEQAWNDRIVRCHSHTALGHSPPPPFLRHHPHRDRGREGHPVRERLRVHRVRPPSGLQGEPPTLLRVCVWTGTTEPHRVHSGATTIRGPPRPSALQVRKPVAPRAGTRQA